MFLRWLDDLIAIRISWRPADRTEVGWLTNQLSALIDINRPSCTNLVSQRFFFSIASFDFWKIPCFPFSLYIFIFNRSNTMKFVFYFLFIIIVALQTMPRLSYDWSYRVSFFVVSHEIFLDNKKKRKEGDDLSRVLCTFLTVEKLLTINLYFIDYSFFGVEYFDIKRRRGKREIFLSFEYSIYLIFKKIN